MFESIECEWPIFFCYLILDYCFQGNKELIEEYTKKLEKITIKTDDGIRLVPELYAVGPDNVAAEYADPGSQEREALGRCPFMWGQSLYILGKLLQEVSKLPNSNFQKNRAWIHHYWHFFGAIQLFCDYFFMFPLKIFANFFADWLK